jgi:hypothetical protein
LIKQGNVESAAFRRRLGSRSWVKMSQQTPLWRRLSHWQNLSKAVIK